MDFSCIFEEDCKNSNTDKCSTCYYSSNYEIATYGKCDVALCTYAIEDNKRVECRRKDFNNLNNAGTFKCEKCDPLF